MKRIVFLTDSLSDRIGGMEIHQNAFVSFFSKENYELLIVTKRPILQLHFAGQVIKEFPTYIDFSIWFRCLSDDTVIFFNNLSWIRQIPLLREMLPNSRFIIRSGGNDILRAPFEDDSIPLFKRQKSIVDIINGNVNVLIVNSDYSYLRNLELGISSRIMIKLRGGVDYVLANELMRNAASRRRNFDATFNTRGRKVITIACRMVDFKGILEFLDYYKEISRDEYFLLLVGDGKLSNAIKDKLSHILPVTDYAFLGEQPHGKAMEYISISDAVINPSIYCKRYFGDDFYIHTETMGRTMLEACAMGIPIVATNVGGTNELFCENSHIGYLLDSLDSLGDALSSVLTGTSWHADMDYSWVCLFYSYERLFENSPAESLCFFDIDNTLLNNDNEIPLLSKFLRDREKTRHIVLNTGRSFTCENKKLAQALCSHAFIAENGLHIFVASQINLDWERFVDRHLHSQFLEFVYSNITSNFPGLKACITHPNSLVFWKDDLIDSKKIELAISKLLNDDSFELVTTHNHIKIINRWINKRTAADFIKKNFVAKITIGAGDNINDLDFCLSCDVSFIKDSLVNLVDSINKKDINVFSAGDVGIPLVEKVFSHTPCPPADEFVENDLFYSGKMPKIGVWWHNKRYILKFIQSDDSLDELYSEQICSLIYDTLFIRHAFVKLTEYNGKRAILIHDFMRHDEQFIPLSAFIEEKFDYGETPSYTLAETLRIIHSKCSPTMVQKSLFLFWIQFIVDFLSGASPRNASNIGFIVAGHEYCYAPMFDNASNFRFNSKPRSDSDIFKGKYLNFVDGCITSRLETLSKFNAGPCSASLEHVRNCFSIERIQKEFECHDIPSSHTQCALMILSENFNVLRSKFSW